MLKSDTDWFVLQCKLFALLTHYERSWNNKMNEFATFYLFLNYEWLNTIATRRTPCCMERVAVNCSNILSFAKWFICLFGRLAETQFTNVLLSSDKHKLEAYTTIETPRSSANRANAYCFPNATASHKSHCLGLVECHCHLRIFSRITKNVLVFCVWRAPD